MAIASDGFATWYVAGVQPMQRSQGQSSVAAAAYRTGERLHDERLDITHDYRARSGVVDTFTIVPDAAPEWAHDPERLWNAAEAAERINGRVARELKLALPHRATDAMRREIVERVSWMLVERYGVGVTAAIHAPPKRGTGENDHAHILFTTRRLEAEGLAKKKDRSVHSLDDRKQGPKEITYIRMQCAEITNAVLAAAGSDERVTHLSMAERGLDAQPGVHHGPRLTAINDERKKRGLDPLEPYRRVAELRKQFEDSREDWAGFMVVDGDVRANDDLRKPDDPKTRHKQRIAEIVDELVRIDSEIAMAERAEAAREEARQEKIEQIAQTLKREKEEAPRDPQKSPTFQEFAAHRAQIARDGSVADRRAGDGQTWWQRNAAQIHAKSRKLRNQIWKSWESGKTTWHELSRMVRSGRSPEQLRRDRERGQGPER